MHDTTITTPTSTVYSGSNTVTATLPSSGFTDFVLGRLRCARIQVRIALNQINAAGVALKGGLIDGEGALEMLGEAGLLHLIEASS